MNFEKKVVFCVLILMFDWIWTLDKCYCCVLFTGRMTAMVANQQSEYSDEKIQRIRDGLGVSRLAASDGPSVPRLAASKKTRKVVKSHDSGEKNGDNGPSQARKRKGGSSKSKEAPKRRRKLILYNSSEDEQADEESTSNSDDDLSLLADAGELDIETLVQMKMEEQKMLEISSNDGLKVSNGSRGSPACSSDSAASGVKSDGYSSRSRNRILNKTVEVGLEDDINYDYIL